MAEAPENQKEEQSINRKEEETAPNQPHDEASDPAKADGETEASGSDDHVPSASEPEVTPELSASSSLNKDEVTDDEPSDPSPPDGSEELEQSAASTREEASLAPDQDDSDPAGLAGEEPSEAPASASEPPEKDTQHSSSETMPGSEVSVEEDQETVRISGESTLDLEPQASTDPPEEDESLAPTDETTAPEITSSAADEAAQSGEASEPEAAADSAQPQEASESSPGNDDDQEDTDDGESDDDEDQESPDYSQLDREGLLQEMEKLARAENTKSAYSQARQLRTHFDELEEAEREKARQQYISEGGEADGFEFRSDNLNERFYAAFGKIRQTRSQQRVEREKSRQQNLEAKQEILNRLRDFVDSEETQVSINKLKELQSEWRNIGEVPPQQNRSLWANYHALLDRFYDNRSIYFELKELDRKKNLESKQALAARAEELAEEPDLKKATQELDELHEEYKHLGPVPRDEQEALWQRFKAASDTIHDRRRENVEAFKEQLQENLTAKLKLADEVVEYTSFDSDSIKEWNKKTKDIQQLQQQWNAVGSMPRSQAKEVNKKFWSNFKEFFAHKGEFFKRLDAMREENLQKKEALVSEAEQLKDSDDWRATSNELKRLQREWKDIGPVPEKSRESVYQKFKAACDHFFNRRRANSQETEVEYQKNLQQREAICEQIEKLADEKSSDLEALDELTAQYAETGFVPRSAMKTIGQRYQAAIDKFLKNAKELDETQKQEVQVSVELGTMRNSPGAHRKINQKEGSLRRQISRLEDDISVWKTNINFFTSSSKQADKLIADVERKIDKASAELEQLRSQLDVLQSMRDD